MCRLPMKNIILATFITLTSLLVVSCGIIQKQPDTKPVRLIFYNELNIVSEAKSPVCRYLGELVGSEGHWYTYWFESNTNLTHGALNDIHNKANDLGANVVYINDQIPFITSVTFYGQAYYCDYDDE